MGVKRESTAINDYFSNVIKKSWTWQHLTDEEKSNFIGMTNIFSRIKGNDIVRVEWFNTIYESFIVALGYKPFGWRENRRTLKF